MNQQKQEQVLSRIQSRVNTALEMNQTAVSLLLSASKELDTLYSEMTEPDISAIERSKPSDRE